MTDKINTCRDIVINFFENRISTSELYKAREYISKKDNEIKETKDEKKLSKLIEAKKKKQDLLTDLRNKAPSTVIREWLDKYTDKENKKKPIKTTHRASSATHLLKFTHSSAPNGYINLTEKSDDLVVTTSSLKKEPRLDIAHSDGQLISISRFLNLKLVDGRIIDQISNGNFRFFWNFSNSEDQIKNWIDVFSNLVSDCQIKTADKAKQLYFPLTSSKNHTESEDNPYHLIIPLFPSSLADELYQVIDTIKFGEEQKNIRKCNRADNIDSPTYHSGQFHSIPNIALQCFGGEHPKNVSMLNADRSGKAYLLSTEPPIWQNKLKPPVNNMTWFGSGIPSYMISEEIKYLRNFLICFDRLKLSIKDPKRKERLIERVKNILSIVMFQATSIQNLPSGWSDAADIALKPEHQYFLDPYRKDDDFQNNKKISDWQNVVANDFSRWLNKRLQGKEKKYTPQEEHSKLWVTLMLDELREHNQMIEATINECKGGQ